MRPGARALGGLAAAAALLAGLLGCADDADRSPVQQYLAASCAQWTALADLQSALRQGELPKTVAAARRMAAAADDQARALSRPGWPDRVAEPVKTLHAESLTIASTARTIGYVTAPPELWHIPDVSLVDEVRADSTLRTQLHLPPRCSGR